MVRAYHLINQQYLNDKPIIELLRFEQREEFLREFLQWCYKHKDILGKIQSEKLEELSDWNNSSDQTFIEDKLFIDKMTEMYQNDNENT